MGGEGSGRKPDVTKQILNAAAQRKEVGFTTSNAIELPDYSGAAKHTRTRQAFVEQDKKYLFYLHDDFLGANSINTVGETSWTRPAVIGGAAAWTVGTGTANHFGILRFNTGTIVSSTNSITKPTSGILLSGDEELTFMVNLPNPFDTHFQLLFGLSSSSSNFVTNGLYFFYDDSVGAWQCGAYSNSSGSLNTTTVSGDFLWYELKIKLNSDATKAFFYINDVLVYTENTNIPNITGREMGILVYGKNTSNIIGTDAAYLDYVTFKKSMPAGR